MKKFALGFLSVFILLGGILFSACDKKVSLSLLTDQEVTIFTNDESAENFTKDNVEVLLENSSDGIGTEIKKGDDVIKLSKVSQKADGRYSFDIETLENKKSGKAEVRVYSIEDPSQSKMIYVNVNTILEGIDIVQDNNVDARSNYFVVKGARENQSVWKDLNIKEFFEFNPVTANVYDVNWTFENDQVQLIDGDKVLALIENGKLWVSKDYNLQTISLKATDITKGANNIIELKVLEDSTIKSFTMGGTDFYVNNQQKIESASYEFVRNNVYESNISGEIVINTSYDVTFEPVVKIGKQELAKEEWLEYFSFDFSKPEINQISKTTTYNFTINAYDALVYNKLGDLDIDFRIGYENYNYDISTNLNVIFKTFYQATNIEVLNSDGHSLNKNEINVFSNYQSQDGYEIRAILMPDDVGLDNSTYAISIDTTNLGGMNPSDFAKFYYRGEQLTFENTAGSYKFTTITQDAVLSGDKIYVVATENYDVLEDVDVEFIPYSNPDKSTVVTMNFYKISTGDTLNVTSDLEVNEFYVSSSLASERKLKLNFKVSGLSTVAGLEVVSNNDKFKFLDNLTQIETGEDEGVDFVVLSCEVELTDYNFEERASFYFSHVSGKKSNKFYINSFIPLETLSVSNNDKSATNYYNQKEAIQDYVLNSDGNVEKVSENASTSLSSIMLEAGTSLPIFVDTRNATLAEEGIVYKFLSYEDLKNALVGILGIDLNSTEDIEKLDNIVEGLIKSESVEIDTALISETVNSLDFVVSNVYDSFGLIEDMNLAYFSINTNKIVLTDSEFKGFVCVLYNGFDESHNEKTLLRLFAIESFNKVTHFSTNIKTASLYTSQTLSFADMAKSYVDVTLTFRTDNKTPTYTNDLSLLSFKSSIENFEFAGEDGYFTPNSVSFVENSYYSISDMTFTNGGRSFRFRITANSTNLQTQVRDILRIVYRDENGFEKATEIQIQIQNVKRIESVEWTTRTIDNEIYLNLTSAFANEKNFTITTSFTPSDANDTGLSYIYSPIAGTRNDLDITTSSIGSTFNLNLNTNKGGYGYLYILPNDMVKVVEGIRHFMVYKYSYDESGNLIETPVLIEMSKLKDYFDMLVNSENASDEFDQYFLNNDGERVYYKDIVLQIRITIADGLSQETAIRVYSQSDLEVMDYAKYYEIMNDISLSNWKKNTSLDFSGMLFGNTSDITLNFKDSSQQLFNTIASKGIVKDFTIVGQVDGNGFVANENKGTIDNVKIDVYYANNVYVPSTLNCLSDKTKSEQVGVFVGTNSGIISNSYNFGASIVAKQVNFAGGIAGRNSGTIANSGVEFYQFKEKNNTIDTTYQTGTEGSQAVVSGATIGGIVGLADAQSKILKSYVYAYSLGQDNDVAEIFLNTSQNKGAFVGSAGDKALIEESFAYLGNLSVAYNTTTSANIKNSYVSYYDRNNSNLITSDVFDSDGTKTTITDTKQKIIGLDKTIWEVENIDSEINFGFMHLKNVQQTRAKDVTTLSVKNVGEDNIKSLRVEDKKGIYKKGILFAYVPVVSNLTQSEKSVLNNLNKISLQELFGVDAKEAQTLLVTSKSKDISISKNAIQVLSSNLTEFDLVVYSKMDFSKFETFKFVILNNLPKVSMTLDGQLLQNGQIMLLQTGSANARNVYFNFNNSIYLGGENVYRAETNDYSMDVTVNGKSLEENNKADDSNISASINKTKLSLVGKSATTDAFVNVEGKLSIGGLANGYNDVVKGLKNSFFDVSVFDGATALVVEDSSELFVKPSQNDSFEVTMHTDNASDNLVFELKYGDIKIESAQVAENYVQFVVDEKLTLNVSWGVEGELVKTFKVLVEIDQNSKHKINQAYDLELLINAKSLKNSEKLLKVLPVYVSTQEVSDVDLMVYDIQDRQIKNSVLYLNPSNKTLNAIAPSSDAILSVVVDPAHALMTHFTLTYSMVYSSNGAEVNTGTVNITKLSYNSMYGFYVNTASTSLIENGIRVNLSDADKMGNGVYYFRVYISGVFASGCDLKLTLNIYNNETCVKTGSQSFVVDYLANANIKVNNSSNYLMSKGSSATVTVSVGLDQKLSLTLQNNAQGISLSSIKEDVFDTYKLYTATLTAYVDAKLSNGKENGIFHVDATVSRVINGELELKTSRASVYLVDFSIDPEGIKVNSSGATSTYNGKTYDVFYAYINSSETLRFDYPILPDEYIYNTADANQVAKVENLQQKQNEFLQKNYYKDDEAGYYINHKFNQRTGKYESISLKQQLSYAVDEETSSKIYSDGGYFLPNDKISITGDNNALKVKGLRTGKQLMKLQTIVVCDGVEFVKDYYFLIVVEVWSDEEIPTQITSGEQFVKFATESEHADDYILMNDIVLENYTPINTELIDSLDGNGYTIHLNSFDVNKESSSLDLALFNTVAENTTLKNVRVNIYGAGEINVDILEYQTINIAGFALTNNGTIYNCEVVSYFDDDYQTQAMKRKTNGIVVNYMRGANTDPIEITQAMKIESNVAGFAINNNRSIINSRVGGESFRHIVFVDDIYYVKTEYTDVFTINAQGNVAGFVIENGSSQIDTSVGEVSDKIGYISACFVDHVEIINKMDSDTSITAGFIIHNFNNVQGCYVEGSDEEKEGSYIVGTKISADGYIGGFIYENDGLVKNSYSNIKIDNEGSIGSYVAGFVYKNNIDAEVRLCFASCQVAKRDVNEMQFSGVDPMVGSLNNGTIEYSYYYNKEQANQTNENALSVGPLAVSDMTRQDTFYGFSFASSENNYDGIWCLDDEVLSLVSANNIALSSRYAVTTGNITTLFYNKTILDIDTLQTLDLSYGSIYNPIIIRSSEEFAKAMGKAQAKEISSYKEYYSDKEVFGNYRLVNNIDMSQIDQNAEGTDVVKLTTSTKTFKGLIDGNGFTISNISLVSSSVCENFGLFAKLENAVIMNLDLIVESIKNRQAHIVGTLAGTAIDTRILAINIRPKDGGVDTSILGNNVVGGVVGMLFGESKIHDVVARRIDVYSSFNPIDEAKKAVDGFRKLVDKGLDLSSQVSKVSYAGALVGFADVYNLITDEDVLFNINPNVQNYDLVTVRVYDSVKIYAEVAGGLFGYVGPSTYVYDATIQLNAGMDLTNPSYIISKNLYAGGLIGENHGAIFGSYASYEKSLQDDIDKNQNSYYNGNSNVERGQQSIFSYASSAENEGSNANNPKFVGGLVGYMEGGYIYVSYNKLNVISNSASTLAVGGIVGYVDATDRKMDVPFSQTKLQANTLLYDVYSSGDFYINNATKLKAVASDEQDYYSVGAGVIGALGSNDFGNTSVVMKNVMAVNYLSVADNKLSYDEGEMKEIDGVSEYVANRHYSLIGNILYQNENEFKVEKTLKNKIYVFDQDNIEKDILNLSSNEVLNQTVGGYLNVEVSNTKLNLNAFAFSDNNSLLSITNIGSNDMKQFEIAQAQMYSYFLPVGWTVEYWVHESDMLFPEIELLPKIQVYYLDAITDDKSAQKALDVFNAVNDNNTATIVVRGKVNPDNIQDQTSLDVDLTALRQYGISLPALANFQGRIISYADYNLNDDNVGKVYTAISGGGQNGDNVGIIIDQSLFSTLKEGARVEGLNVYMKANAEDAESEVAAAQVLAVDEDGSNEPSINYSFVSESAYLATFKNVNFVLNANVEIEKEFEKASALVVPLAQTTSFSNINIKSRNNSIIEIGGSNVSYVGVLAGKITQETSYMTVDVSNNKIFAINGNGELLPDTQVNVTLTVGSSDKDSVYSGLYAGYIEKSVNAHSTVEMQLCQLDNVALTANVKSNVKNAYIGGYVGKIDGLDKLTITKDFDDTENEVVSKIVVNHNVGAEINQMYSGLLFGSAQGTSINLNIPAQTKAYKIQGGIYQELSAQSSSVNNAYIGGLIGDLNSQASIGGISLDFTLASSDLSAGNSDRKTKLAENVKSYESETSYKKTSYKINKNENAQEQNQNAIGAYFGRTSGTVGFTSGNATVEGLIDISSSNTCGDNIGAMVGQVDGSLSVYSANITNSLDIAYINAGDSYVYIGGIVGQLTKVEDKENNTEIAYQTTFNKNGNSFIHYVGNVVSSVKKLTFGGGIGYVQRQAWNTSSATIKIANVAFGGALKVWQDDQEGINDASVTAGGVVGAFNIDNDSNITNNADTYYSIANCYSYGDVFVNYPSEKNYKLESYNFGGIVGKAGRIKVEGNYSLMTSFNNRLSGTNGEEQNTNWTISNYNVGAIVGGNSSIVYYENNYYNSGVCMAYQTETGNVDAVYNHEYKSDSYTGGHYLGYSSAVENDESITGEIKEHSGKGLLDVALFGRFATDAEEGTKLNPYKLGDSKKSIGFDTQSDIETIKLSEENKTHNISWVAVINDYDLDDTNLASQLENVAIVGNGHTITRKLGSDNGVEIATTTVENGNNFGGLVDVLGTSGMSFKMSFNMISGVVVNLSINADVPSVVNTNNIFGGVVGKADGQSFVYGISVKGELSVGGTSDLHLGGVVGQMYNGFINECAVDADILYRANTSGRLSGIAEVINGNTTIKATYSSGKLQTYVSEIGIYALAYGTGDAIQTHDVVNSYSISNIKRLDVEGSEVSGTNYLVSGNGNIQTKEIFYLEGMKIKSDSSKGIKKLVSEMAVGYSGNDLIGVQNSLMKYVKPTDETVVGESLTPWYFNPFVNYGFASHGFGYMKNVTAYERTRGTKNCIEPGKNEVTTSASMQIENAETGEIESYDEKFNIVETAVVKSYDYSPVGYYDLVTDDVDGTKANVYQNDWYLGVFNSGKFAQMIDTVNSTNGEGKNYKFVLSEDIKVLNDGNVTGETFGQDVGSEGFVLDGNGHTIDFESDEFDYKIDGFKTPKMLSSGVFGKVVGDIINLKVANIKILSLSDDNVGGLASKVTGNINNITVDGKLFNGKTKNVGGVVGYLVGNATAIDSLVNIDSSKAGVFIGGVVGYLNGGTITHSANSGILNSTSDYKSSSELSTEVKEIEGAVQTTTEYYSSIMGGVVGYSSGGNVKYSYNTNAVMSGYAKDKEGNYNKGNYIAGGVVGYANGTTLDNNNNTGLVGAGNYNNEKTVISDEVRGGVAIAGGIIGYGTGNTTMSNCTNEGAVEALGPEDGDYDFAFEKNSGTYTQDLTNAPKDLKLNVTLTYNPGDTRQVFAYGLGMLGVGSSGSFDTNNYTTTENVKNDGNIGEISVSNNIYFDRSGMINQDANKFRAIFSLGGYVYDEENKNYDQISILSDKEDTKDDKNQASQYIYTNGVDSYGFPIRVYMKDVMTRGYYGQGQHGTYRSTGRYQARVRGELLQKREGKWPNYTYRDVTGVNHIQLDSYNTNPDGGNASTYSYNKPIAEWVFSSSGETNKLENSDLYYDRKESYQGNDESIYTMSSSSEYYASTFFPKYDDLLKGFENYLEVNYFEFVIGEKINGKYNYLDDTNQEKVSNLNFNLIGRNYNNSNNTVNGSEINLDGKVANIDKLKDSNNEMKTTTIGGKVTAVASTGGQISSVYNPYSISVNVDLSSGLDDDAYDSITKHSFKISDINGSKPTQNYFTAFETDKTNKIWTITAYFGSNIGADSITVETTYEKSGEFILGKNNIIDNGNGTVTVYLQDQDTSKDEMIRVFVKDFLKDEETKKNEKLGLYLNSIQIEATNDEGELSSINLVYDENNDGEQDDDSVITNLFAGTETMASSFTFNNLEGIDLTSLNNGYLKMNYTVYSWSTGFGEDLKVAGPTKTELVNEFKLGNYATVDFSNQATTKVSGVTYEELPGKLDGLFGQEGSIIYIGDTATGVKAKYKNDSWVWEGVDPSETISELVNVIYSTDKYTANIYEAELNNSENNKNILINSKTYDGPDDNKVYLYKTEALSDVNPIEATVTEGIITSDLITSSETYYLKLKSANITIDGSYNYGYTMTVEDVDSNIVDIKHWVGGDLEYSLSANNSINVDGYEKVDLEGTDSEGNINQGKFAGSFDSLDANGNISKSYKVSNVEDCPYCDDGNCSGITTLLSTNNAEDEEDEEYDLNEYGYTIYSCGVIETYKVSANVTADGKQYKLDDSYKVAYVNNQYKKYDLEQIDASVSQVIQTNQIFETDTEENIVYIWSTEHSSSYNEYKDIEEHFEYIVGDVSSNNKNISFVKALSGESFKASCNITRWEQDYNVTRQDINVGIYYSADIPQSHIFEFSDLLENETEPSEIYYNENNSDEQALKHDTEGKFKLENATYGQTKYEYRYKIIRTNTFSGDEIAEEDNSINKQTQIVMLSGDSSNSTGSIPKTANYEIVVLANDASMGASPIAQNTKNLYGDNHVVKVSGMQLIEINKNTLQNIKIVQSSSESGLDKDDDLKDVVITENTEDNKVYNVTYFGNLRVGTVANAKTVITHKVSLFGGITSGGIDGNVVVTTQGNVDLNDDKDGKIYSTNNNVLITSDGKMGAISPVGQNGNTDTGIGGIGETAGTISRDEAKYVREGYDGLGGYGQNGKISSMTSAGTRSIKDESANGGKAGENGGTRLRNATQYSGNAGVCMPGKWHMSNVKGIRTSSEEGNSYYGAGINEISFSDYPNNFKVGNKDWGNGDWSGDNFTEASVLDLFNLAFKVNGKDATGWFGFKLGRYGSATGDRKLIVKGGDGYIDNEAVKFSTNYGVKVYVRVQIRLEYSFEGDNGYYPGETQIIVWTSGEIVNSGTYGKSFDEAWGFSGKVCG